MAEENLVKHKLISIGFLGNKRCYLDISKAEAIERYLKIFGFGRCSLYSEETVDEFEFDDEFSCYDVWSAH